MSAILSADDLNDFISPGVACIKPIETLPAEKPADSSNPYEVTTEEKVAAQNPTPAQISLTDCLACSGCVTSAEAVLVSLQSHTEVLNTLDAHPSLYPPWLSRQNGVNGVHNAVNGAANGSVQDGKLFIASISPQTRASLAAVYGVSSEQAGNMISHLLSGPSGLAAGGQHGSSFLWTIDTNTLRSAALFLAAEEVASSLEGSSINDNAGNLGTKPKKPILTSACPGWICYAEKTHPYILPHLSRLKSPQALAGTLLKSTLAKRYGVRPEQVWHLAIMPCFDKKLEASRSELTSSAWAGEDSAAIRDVDCVITARELISLAEARGINFADLPRTHLKRDRVRFPDPTLDKFLFPNPRRKHQNQLDRAAGSGGGYLWHILQRFRVQNPGSRIKIVRGRNADVVEYMLVRHNEATGREEIVFKAARYYGFRNIQNLVRRLKPKGQSKLLAAAAARSGARRPGGGQVNGTDKGGANSEYAYVEVMACPGGCTNGGGQIKVGEVQQIRGVVNQEDSVPVKSGPQEQREWLGKVDEAYFSAESSSGVSEDEDSEDGEVVFQNNGFVNGNGDANGEAMDIDTPDDDIVDGISRHYIQSILQHWANITDVEKDSLVFTSYRKVESDVGKVKKQSDVERVAGLASSIGGGW